MPKLFKILPIIIVSGFLFLLSNQPRSSVKAAGTTYYVSKTGSNGDGASWDTAWNELDQINWDVIQAGNTILLDGGSTECSFPTEVTGTTNTPQSSSGGDCGMVYQSTLAIGKSGQTGNPVTIKLASESGRNGTVRIFGGRSTSLPLCDQPSYAGTAVRRTGISNGGQDNIVIDGTKLGGIKVYGFKYGLTPGGTQKLTVKNVEVFDNGDVEKDGKPEPNQEGIPLNGTNVTLEKVIIHDNGQDAIQATKDANITNFVLRNSWLYNARPHPTEANEPFNHPCRHSDGIQIWSGNAQSMTVEKTIIGPGFMQGLIFSNATVSNVTVRNVLFVGHHGSSSTSAMSISANANNWTLDHVTVYEDADYNDNTTIYIAGSGHRVKNSIFYVDPENSSRQLLLQVGGNPVTENNFWWNVKHYNMSKNIGTEVYPDFKDKDFSGVGPGFADFDFTVQNPAIPPGTGSSITSVAQLLGQSIQPTPTPTPTPTPYQHCPLLGDIDCSGKVNGLDFAYLVAHWDSTDPQVNLDDAGVVDALDALILLGNYGRL